MTAQVSVTMTGSAYRLAGWAAIISGVIGVLAFGLQFAAVIVRSEEFPRSGDFMFRTHDLGVIFQSLLMIPVAFALHSPSHRRCAVKSRMILAVGVLALSLMILLLSLIFVGCVWDALYLVPQGVLGVWLMVVNRRLSTMLPWGLTWLGTVAGLGMVLVGTFPITYALFVEPVGLQGPDPNDAAPPTTTANIIIHNVLVIGSFMGVLTYPIWAILLGRRLLRARDF